MLKKIISIFLAMSMLIVMIPLDMAYAGTAVTAMQNVIMNQQQKYQDISYNFTNQNTPLPRKGSGPLYDDIFFNDPDVTWTRNTGKDENKNEIGYVAPGERPTASFGFCVDLKKSKLLGAVRKGDLTSVCTVRAKNYGGDGDFGRAVIIPYDSGGNYLTEYASANYDYNDSWGDMSVSSPYIRKDAYYLVFSAYGERKGGVFNKYCDFYVNSIYGRINDSTGPKVVSISDTATVNGKQYIRQNINKNDPSIYVTMDEDCTFGTGNKVMLDTVKSGTGKQVITDMYYVGEVASDNNTGHVTYKFRISLSDTYGHLAGNHFYKVKITGLYAYDTMGNSLAQNFNELRQIECNKYIDTRAPYLISNDINNTYVEDEFGLQKVTYSLTHKDTNVKIDVNKHEVGDVENIAVSDAKKTVPLELSKTTITKTGFYNLAVTPIDLAGNQNTINSSSSLFLISDSDPMKMTLCKNGGKFDLSYKDISNQTTDALTTMTLKANVPSSVLNDAMVYYRWVSEKDDQLISKFAVEQSKWKSVNFKKSSNETEALTIPVTFKSTDTGDYVEPNFKEGYLYVIPFTADALSSNKLRAGSMVLGGDYTDGKFKMITNNTVNGIFVDRGCQCTGTTPSAITAEAHYMAIRNHTMDIGFDVNKADNSNLDKIMWSIKKANVDNSVLASGAIDNSVATNKYDIPISSVKGLTGSYIVTVSLYSNSGDVTVKRINLNIENPIVGISSIMYNQETQNLDFTLTYNKESADIRDIIIELCDKEITEFKEEIEPEEGSIYESDTVISMDVWDSQLFAGTKFIQDSKNPKLMKANFRVSLTNMERAGDSFVKRSGEKRVHLKYVTSNNVTAVNNNIAVIRKSNIPPSITMNDSEMSVNKYNTASVCNDGLNPLIKVSVEEPLGNLTAIKYGWVDNPNTSLSSLGGAVETVALGTDTKKKDFNPVVPKVEGVSDLYKIKYLTVYAKNSFGKSSEKIFGPFYVLNEEINDKRFLITVTDKALGREKEVLAAVDDRLYYIDEDKLPRVNKIRVTWQDESEADNKVIKEYDLSFKRKEGDTYETSNLALVNINYPELWDTDGKGGTYKLSKVEIYNSNKPDSLIKAAGPFEIAQTLKAYYVTISSLDKNSFKVSSSQENTDIQYGWSNSKLDIPSSLTSTTTGISGTKITFEDKGNLFDKFSYLFVKAWNILFRSEALTLEANSAESINIASVVIGEETKEVGRVYNKAEAVPLIITVSDPKDINKIVKLEVYDLNSVTSSTAISADKVYKLSDNQVFTILPALTTSGGAIKCSVFVNGDDKGDYSAASMSLTNPLNYVYSNKTIALDDSVAAADYQYYKVYDEYGRIYTFKGNKAEIFANGTYIAAYSNGGKFYAESIRVEDISYTKDDVQVILNPEKNENKVISPVKATIIMPLGSVIKDKYGVLTKVEIEEGRVKAEASFPRNAEYTFDVDFPNGGKTDYKVKIDYINESYIPPIAASTSSSAIVYDTAGPLLTSQSVKAKLNDSYNPLNNSNSKEYIFDSNGVFSFAAIEEGLLVEHVARVSWIDKNCPKPTITKYVWNDKNNNKIVDEGEKTVTIPSGFKTKYNVITEITFPAGENARPVKLSGSTNFTAVEKWDINPEYAYKYVFAYSPENQTNTLLVENLTFEDTLGNKTDYTLIIDEIDKTALLTQLVYSTMDYTNRDVIVSMLSNKAIMRFEKVEAVAADGTVKTVEKEASPTYVFKENGSKDFNYRELNFVEGAEEGKLTANVTWIDKSVPDVIVNYDSSLTKSNVKINFEIINGVAEGARLSYGSEPIMLTASGNNFTGHMTVSENNRYNFTVSTKYGNTSTFIVPITNIDNTPPEINILGRETVYIKLGEKYYDKGATAFDNRDKDISKAIAVESNVNTAKATGNDCYEVKYSVSDKAGNTVSKTRKVYVLDISSAVAIVENKVIDLLSQNISDVKIDASGMIYLEFVGIDGYYTVKYQSGEKDGAGNYYDNSYFKTNGRFLSKTGTVAVSKGIYTFHIMDQERNTRIIKINFTDK